MDTRRALAGISALAVAAVLAACGGEAEPEAPAAPVAESAPPTETAAAVLTELPDAATLDELMSADVMEVDGIYVDKVRAEYPEQTADLDDETITSIGHDACLAFGDGATVEDVTADTLAAGVDLDVGAYIVGGGLAVYCAEYLSMLTGEH